MPSAGSTTSLAVLVVILFALCFPWTPYASWYYPSSGDNAISLISKPNSKFVRGYRSSQCNLGAGTESYEIGYGSGSIWPWRIYKSSPFNPPVLRITSNGRPLARGLIFITPSDFGKTRATKDVAPLILTDTGQLVWHGPTENATNLRVASYQSKSILTYFSGVSSEGANVGHGYGSITFLDSSYNVILTVCPKLGLVTPDNRKYPCEADIHESFVTDRDTILITAYNATRADLSSIGGPKQGWVFDSLVFEIDPRSGNILFRWSSLEHVPVSETKLPLGNSGKKQAIPFDYFHINSVVNIGDNFLVNGRHVWSVYLVGPKGNVIWTLQGDTGGDFGALPPNGKFSWQHYPRPHQITKTSITITLFNNFNSQIDNGTHPTNGLELLLSLPPNKSTPPKVLKHLSDPSDPIYADSQGSSSLLPNGNTFLGYGQIAVLREFGPDSPSGTHVRWSARFGADNLVQSYRGFRQEWHASPQTVPSLVVHHYRTAKGCGAGFVSWNGATDVTGWAVYEGPEEDRLVRVGEVKYRGFETRFGVGKKRCVQVAAVVGGKEGKRSDVKCR